MKEWKRGHEDYWEVECLEVIVTTETTLTEIAVEYIYVYFPDALC
jgi:hypothetical protein